MSPATLRVNMPFQSRTGSTSHLDAERLAILGQRDGVWRCRTIFNCSDACPRGIPVTDLIEQVKRAIIFNDTNVE